MLNIKILGPGCYNCERLKQATIEALEMLGVEATLQHITDYNEFIKYRLLFTPGLVVNEKLVAAGWVPSPEDIVALLTSVLNGTEQAAPG